MASKVSICIPTYNGSKFLAECLDSVVAQSFTAFELLVVDDQSSDDTAQIVRQYADRDSRVRFVRNERNLGLVENWNRCVELAEGEWIKFVFQDDRLAPQCLELMLNAAGADLPIVFCRRDFWFGAETSEFLRNYYANHKSTVDLFDGRTYISGADYAKKALDYFPDNIIGEPTALLLHKDVFYRYGTFNKHLVMLIDWEYWTRIAVHTGIKVVPEVLATFRVHGDSATANTYAQSTKAFRAQVDNIIILHEFAFSPLYEPLRIAAAERNQVGEISTLLTRLASNAWATAMNAANDATNPSAALVEEWNKIESVYPILGHMKERLANVSMVL
jgi:Glycosyltransferases involved in cell wall biogenesis